jgi:TLC domain
VILVLAVIIHAASWWPRWLVYEPLANWRMEGGSTSRATTKTATAWEREECRRFSMTCTSCLFFTLSAVFANRVLLPKEWLFDRNAWTVREPNIDADFKFYYLMYAARFVSDLVSLFYESRSRDAFVAALVHHLTTLGLVLSSAYVGHTRYGGIIMFFFDWADIPLLAAKGCKYLSKNPTDAFEFVARRLFEVFAVLFVVTRVIYYNYVVYCALVDLSDDWVNRSCQSLLLVLVCLQTYWLTLIINALVRVVTKGALVDERDADLKEAVPMPPKQD